MKKIISKLNFNWLKNHRKVIFIALAIILAMAGTSYASFKIIENKKESSEAMSEVQNKLNELQEYKDGQLRIEEEKIKQEENEQLRLEEEKNGKTEKEEQEKIFNQRVEAKNQTIQECENLKELCKKEMEGYIEISSKDVNWDYGTKGTIKTAEKYLEQIENYNNEQKGYLDNCEEDNTSEGGIKRCKDIGEERVKNNEEDIKFIEDKIKDAEKEVANLKKGKCKNYQKSCE